MNDILFTRDVLLIHSELSNASFDFGRKDLQLYSKKLAQNKNCCLTVFSTLESNYDIHFPGIYARYNYITPWPYRRVISFLVGAYKFNHEVI
jgi:hypothetical protein